MNLKEIAEELGVNTILEGSIRKSGNRIRVTAQLIDADTDEHLWTEQFDADFEDIFAVQSNIARKIAEKFNITITESVEMQLKTPPTLNMEAYDLFLKARQMSFDEWGYPKRRGDSLWRQGPNVDTGLGVDLVVEQGPIVECAKAGVQMIKPGVNQAK